MASAWPLKRTVKTNNTIVIFFTKGALIIVGLFLTFCSFKRVRYAVDRNKVLFVLLAILFEAGGLAALLEPPRTEKNGETGTHSISSMRPSDLRIACLGSRGSRGSAV